MAKTHLAVYDESQTYVDRFINYSKKRLGMKTAIIGFTDTDALINYLKENKIKILLISEEEWINKDEDPEIFNERIIETEHVEKLIYLGERKNSRSKLLHINKYQSMNKILNEVEELFDAKDEEEVFDAEADIFGIYSPSSNSKVKGFAYTICETLAQNKKVLYINLERFSGINTKLKISKDSSISNLIYFYKTNPKKLREGLEDVKIQTNGFDILTAPLDMSDIDEIELDDWKYFINAIAIAGEYQAIVIDMYEAFNNLEPIFSMCKKVYMPLTGGKDEKEKVYEFKEYFEIRNRTDLLKKISGAQI